MIRHRAISVNREIALCSSTLQASHNPLPKRLIQKSCVSLVGTQSKKIQLLTDIPRGIKPDFLARQRHAARLPQPNPPCVAPGGIYPDSVGSPALFPTAVGASHVNPVRKGWVAPNSPPQHRRCDTSIRFSSQPSPRVARAAIR
jgi:hypothetical protein